MKITSVNPEILKWARLKSNVLNDKIVATMGNDLYLRWEKGLDYPTYAQLEKLMFLYKFPIAISFFPEIPNYDDSKISFRTIPMDIVDGIDYRIVNLFNKARAFQINLSELDEVFEENLASNIVDSIKPTEDLESISQVIKSLAVNFDLAQIKIKNTKNYFDYWRDELFEHGIYVFKDSFGDESISGFSIYDRKYPIIYINNKHAHSRQLFTLFHELFHLISKTNGIDFTHDEFFEFYDYDLKTEYLCNEFAGVFLVPEKELHLYCKNVKIDIKLIEKISQKFKVSREVVLRRMFDLKIINFDFYINLKDVFKFDYRRVKPLRRGEQQGDYYNNQMTYLGSKYLELTFTAYYREKISITQLGKYTNMKYKSLQEIAFRKHWREL